MIGIIHLIINVIIIIIMIIMYYTILTPMITSINAITSYCLGFTPDLET